MNNFNEVFNATLNANHTISVHVNKSYTGNYSKHFYIYCDGVRLLELSILDERETPHHLHYVLGNVPGLKIGSEYRIYDDRYLSCYLDMNILLKDEKICSLYRCDEVMGAHYHKYYTTFRIFSPLANAAYVCYTKDGKENIVTLEKDEDQGIFFGRADGDLAKCTYYFVVRINGELISTNDPYAKALTNQSIKGVIVAPNDVKVDLKEECLPEFEDGCDAVIYEMSVRDMTSMKGTSIRHKGKFLGLCENSCLSKASNPIGIDYLKYLGVTHVQLQPIFDFCTVCDEHPTEAYNWGYDPMYFNTPEGSFSSNPNDPYARIIELKQMIAKLHKAGIRVVMDVVYNHVFNMESSPFEKICPSYYFRYKQDGTLSNGSFCGNEFNSNHIMAKKFIIDSCLMWVKDYGIDGFRFDLMGLLDIDTIQEVKSRCEKIKPGFLVYGEGWDMPSVVHGDKLAKLQNALKMPKVGFFNDRFRDIVKGKSSDYELSIKGYLSGDTDYIDGFKHCFLSSTIPLAFPPLFCRPQQSINFTECHDNATIFDKLKVSNSFEDEDAILKRVKLINAATILSCGVPFLHAGQEIGLSKKNVYNSYNSGDEINKFDYDVMDKRFDMVNFTRDLIKIKKQYSFFRLKDKNQITNTISFKNINMNALEITYSGAEVLPFEEVKVIFNPTKAGFNLPLEDNFNLMFNEFGLVEEPIVINELIIEPLSINIIYK